MKQLVPFLLLLTLAVTGCQQHDHTAEIRTIDSLKAEVTKAEQIFYSIVPTEVTEIRDGINADLDSARVAFETHNITITPDDGLFFARYKALTSPVESFTALYNKIKTEMAKTHEQLNNLKTDLANNTVDPEKVGGYIKAEKNAVNTIGEAVRNLDAAVKNLKGNAPPASRNFDERFTTILAQAAPKKKK